MNTIEFLEEARRFEARQNLYLWLLIGLFSLALVMTLVLIYWPFDKEDEK